MDYGKTTRVQDLTPSSYYKFWLPGQQAAGSGAVVDQSGNGADFSIDSGTNDAAVWANAGAFTTAAGADGGVLSANGVAAYDLYAGESLIFAGWLNSADPAGSDGGIGEQNTAARPGVRVTFQTNQKLAFAVGDGTTSVNGGSVDTVTLDSTWHHWAVFIDGATKLGYGFVDGVSAAWAGGTGGDFSTVAATTANTATAFNFGCDYDGQTSFAAQFKDWHHIVIPAGVTVTNYANVIQLLYSRPFYPIQTTDLST